jgi:hypothetical protein
MIHHKRLFISKKFVVGQTMTDLAPEVELAALNSLKKMLLECEAYEKVQLVQYRINEVIDEIEGEQIIASLLK